MATKGLTDEFLQEVMDDYHLHGENVSELARIRGAARTTAQHWVQTALRRGISPYDALPTKDEREILGLKEQVKALETELRTVQRDNLSAEIVRKTIIGLKAQDIDPPEWVLAPKKREPSHLVPSVLWSDWHWGEVVNPEEVNGINAYDLGIAHKRAKMLTEKVIDICFSHMVDPNYPGIVVNLAGDMLSGDIHEELTNTNELPIMPVVIDLVGVLTECIETLADRFGRVFVPCVVGNHGRTTARPRMKQRVHTNFDWLVCSFLDKHFEKDKRVTFNIPTGTDCYYSVCGHRYMLTHGDSLGVKGGDGIIGLLGPVMRGDFKMRRQSGEIGRPYDTLLMGHWHQYVPYAPKLIVNGSLKGFDEFAQVQLRASPERPQQALWFTSPDHGIVSTWPVFLSEQGVPKETEWVAVAT